jgi:hypothetical protein
MSIPSTLCHYYDDRSGPLRNLSALAPPESEATLSAIRGEGKLFAARRPPWYMERRRELEALARSIFVEKGGMPRTEYPHYFTLGRCDWLESWFESPRLLCLELDAIAPGAISFSYGDLFPSFSPAVSDGREYRRQIYTLGEITELVGRYGLPQDWNADGSRGPERYIEVEVWLDAESILSRSEPGLIGRSCAGRASGS